MNDDFAIMALAEADGPARPFFALHTQKTMRTMTAAQHARPPTTPVTTIAMKGSKVGATVLPDSVTPPEDPPHLHPPVASFHCQLIREIDWFRK